MDFTTFVRKPFKVQAVLITKENIEEIAPKIGRIRYKTESGEPFIRVNNRIVPNVPFVYIGFYMTQMGDNIRCYSGKVFDQQFVPDSPEVQELVAVLNQTQTIQDDAVEIPQVEGEEPLLESSADSNVT